MFDEYPTFLGIGVLVTIAGAALTPIFVRRLGKKNLFQWANLTGLGIQLLNFYLSYWADVDTLRDLWKPGRISYVLQLSIMGFHSMVAVTMGALLPDCVEYAE